MAKLRDSGATFKEIGEFYGISQHAVWQKLSRAGFIDTYRSADPEEIDKERLENLYALERLPLKKIASTLDVRPDLIKAALRLHKIPERKPLTEGKYTALLEKLKIGEEVEIESSSKSLDDRLYKTARKLGIKISLQTTTTTAAAGTGKFKVTRVKEVNEKAVPLYQRISKHRLKKLYSAEKLAIGKIAAALGCSINTIQEALKYNKIPRRPSLPLGGSRADIFRHLAVGEETEISCEVKNPVTNLHTIANRMGLKISVKSLGNGRIRVKRIEQVTNKGVPLHQRIDKNQLERLYAVENLSIQKIAALLGCSRVTVREAVKYHKIPERVSLTESGSRVDVFRRLAVGDETEMICEVGHPIINLHTIARRIGIKISIETLGGGGKFKIKRLE